MNENIKLASLFDGSGGFPLAGSLCGFDPVWASEVEPYPIAVTKSRFPDMLHLGSVTDINGGKVSPVDVITFGSPCQDLSVAGKRAGLKHEGNGDEETTRSGLFLEAVRIIKEMRKTTNGRYPTFAVWENVPGAFSSHKGEDFKTVCEELIKIVEPGASMPAVPQSGWPYADCYRGDGWSLAYRVFDAQYWGVPQRRRRIYLVLDLRGERAGEVLFKREGLRGYFTQSRTPWEEVAADTERGIGADDSERKGTGVINLNKDDVQSKAILDPRGIAPALYAGECRAVPYTLKSRVGEPAVAYPSEAVGVDLYNQVLTGYVSKSMTASASDADHVPCVIHLPSIREAQYLFENHSQDARYRGPLEVRPMLPAQHGINEDVSFTLNTADRHAVCYAMQAFGKYTESDTASAMKARDYKDATDLVVAGVDCRNMNEYPELYPTLQAKPNGGQSLNLSGAVRVRYIVRRLTPTECARLQGFPDKWGHPDKKDDFTEEECRFWLDVRNTHAAINGKAVKEYTKEQALSWYNKLHTDSSEYKMWGNGIALPCALYVMQGIAECLGGDEK